MRMSEIPLPVTAFFVFLIGLVVGSFLNVVIARVPEGRSIVRPGSACPVCAAPIKPRDNLPLLSWFLLKGSCRECAASIPFWYPLTELVCGLSFVSVYLRFDEFGEVILLSVLFAALLALAVIDMQYLRLPNPVVGTTAFLGVLICLGDVMGGGDWATLFVALLCALGSFAFYGLVYWSSIFFAHKEGMGLGDVKLAPVIGLFLGYVDPEMAVMAVVGAVFSGGILGVVLILAGRATGETKVPFGVFMAIGVVFSVFFGPQVAEWYFG